MFFTWMNKFWNFYSESTIWLIVVSADTKYGSLHWLDNSRVCIKSLWTLFALGSSRNIIQKSMSFPLWSCLILNLKHINVQCLIIKHIKLHRKHSKKLKNKQCLIIKSINIQYSLCYTLMLMWKRCHFTLINTVLSHIHSCQVLIVITPDRAHCNSRCNCEVL